MSILTNHTILFHGNCIDGWFSAFIAHSVLSNIGTVEMYPISPSATHTWPDVSKMKGTNVLLLDVSVAESHRTKWLAEGVLSVSCIDHHASAIEHWPTGVCPIDTRSCAALQTWCRFYPGIPIPPWLHHIDRVDRWDNPTYEDRCIREVLNVIAHKPVQKKMSEAFELTKKFFLDVSTAEGYAAVVAQGKTILDQKDLALLAILSRGGSFHLITQQYIDGWKLPLSWMGLTVFIIDNTNITLDTTEAAHLVFTHYPACNVFINYRKKLVMSPGFEKETVLYSARSRGFNLTEGTVLKGHPSAAGASLTKKVGEVLPFLLA
jgi:hypothetical protein